MISGASILRQIAVAATLTALATAPAAADTSLQLGETATVLIAPDELAATLRIESVTPTAAESQNKVNTIIRDALALARRNAAITVSTGSYSVWRTGPSPQDRTEKWQASQSISLSAKDGPALLTLVGELQQKGMAVSHLGWRLSRETYRKARQDATRIAIAALRGRVDDAAALLDLRFDHFKEVRLDSASAAPVPPMAPMPVQAMMRATPAEPPTAAAEDVPVSATAQADAILVPR